MYIHTLNGDLYKDWTAHDGAPIYDCIYYDESQILVSFPYKTFLYKYIPPTTYYMNSSLLDTTGLYVSGKTAGVNQSLPFSQLTVPCLK